MILRPELITLAETYCGATGRSESRVAALVGGSGMFYRRLRNGGDCSVTVHRRAVQWFSDHWPDDRPDVPWPSGVDRPARAPIVKEEAA